VSWDNGPIMLFHGTNTASHTGAATFKSTFKYRVDWALCRKDTDFGRGFYTTTSLHQATQWANNSVRRQTLSRGIQSTALILMFQADRDEIAGLDVLSFVRATPDYFQFIDYCRSLAAPHGRKSPPNQKPPTQPHYDVVFGPVSLGKQHLVIHDSDQVSFHTTRAFQCLCNTNVEVYDVGSAGTGLLPRGNP
jgi:Protein of unknown function (DUF3990)